MNQQAPIFASVFGDQWLLIPEVIRKHYQNRAYSNDVVTIKGTMDIDSTGFFNWLFPFFRLFKILVPFKGKAIPTTVYVKSDPLSTGLRFERLFNIPNHGPYHFNSTLVPVSLNTAVEFLFLNIGWRAHFVIENKQVKLTHGGYVWKIFNRYIPLPLDILMGKVELVYHALSDNDFEMKMELTNPLLGRYFYSGTFTISGYTRHE